MKEQKSSFKMFVLVGQLGIGVEQSLQHDEVTGDVLGVGASEGPQLASRGGLEVLGLDVLGHRRLGDSGPLRRPGVAALPVAAPDSSRARPAPVPAVARLILFMALPVEI